MLSRHTVTSAKIAREYYSVADYYTEGQELVGRWGGKLADVLGLSGTVTKDAFDRLCDNLHPQTGKPLTPRTADERRVGEDFTFAGPKSFSIIEALAEEGERKRLLAAFDDAIRETLREDMEPDLQTRVRKNGAFENRTTGNMVWAEYDHSTARPLDAKTPPDMHRHKHVLVFNATFDAKEKRIKAGEFSNIVRDSPYYQAAFFSRLAGKLTAMGYAIDRRADGRWEIAGVPQAVIDKFSKRTDEIEAEAERRGITDAALKAELGAKTRSKKQKALTQAELRRAWDAQLTESERHALAAVYRKEATAATEVTAEQAMAFSIAHGSEKLSVLPEREFKRVALLHGLGDVALAQIDAELTRHGVIVRDIDGRRMATTEMLQAEERFICGFSAAGRGSVRPVGVASGLERGTLNDGQWETACGLLESENRVNLVQGPAGAGKSYMLGKFNEGMRLAGQDVTYLATTTDAADVLVKDGFAAHTVARFILDPKMQQAAKGGYVAVDESSMLGHKDAYRLFALADQLDLKLILVGDPMQHGSVPRGSVLRLLKDYGGLTPFRLTEILRQEDADYRAAAKMLSEGDTLAGFDALDRKAWVKEIADSTERYRQIGAEYLDALNARKSVLVISPTLAEGAKITAELRSQLRAAGKLGEHEETLTRLVPVDASKAELGLTTTYRPGMVIVFHQNAKGHKKSERLTVGDPLAVPVSEAAKFSLYTQEAIGVAVGDVIRFTGRVTTLDGKHKLSNGNVRTVAGFTAKGIKLDNGWVISRNAGHFRHGFVETSFGSQGKTVKRAILAIAEGSLPASNQEQLYVSASRAKERVTLYTDDKAAVREAIQRSSNKLVALDLKTEPTPQAPRRPSRWERMKQHMARLRRLAVIDRTRAAWADRGRQHQRPERQASYYERG
jgi:conjugative relaxase-like TrwC/TraI family protein